MVGTPVVLDKFHLEVHVPNAGDFDRTHVYVINEQIGSLFSLLSYDGIKFDHGYREDPILLLRKGQPFKIRVLSFKGDRQFVAQKELIQQAHMTVEMRPGPLLVEEMSALRLHGRENSIKVDLAYQAIFAKEKKWQQSIWDERIFMAGLYLKAAPCESEVVRGKRLFNKQCTQCHEIDELIVGPALRSITQRRTLGWLLSLIHI